MIFDYQKEKKPILAIIIVVIILMMILIYGVYSSHVNALDNKQCFKNKEVGILLDVIIDTTDTPTVYQKKYIRQKIEETVNSMGVGSNVRVFPISNVIGGLGKNLFDRCKPKSSKDANGLIENRLMIERTYNEKFLADFEGVIDSVLETESQHESPIIEALYDYSRLTEVKASKKEIIIFSDLLQNTDDYSVYSTEKRLDKYPYDVNLKNSDVTVYVLERKGKYRARQSMQFIQDWNAIIGSGVSSLRFEKVRN